MGEKLINLFRSRYVRHLEEENAELRAELRAVMSSLLSGAGLPPLDVQRHKPGPPVGKQNRVPSLYRMKLETQSRQEAQRKEGNG